MELCLLDRINNLLGGQNTNLVYFVQTDDFTVKIGSASNYLNFKLRVKECQRWIVNPKLIGFTYCDRRVESLIHDLFTSFKCDSKGRELFKLEHEVKENIAQWCEWSIYGEFNNLSFEEYEKYLEELEEDCESDEVDCSQEYDNEDSFNWDTLTAV